MIDQTFAALHGHWHTGHSRPGGPLDEDHLDEAWIAWDVARVEMAKEIRDFARRTCTHDEDEVLALAESVLLADGPQWSGIAAGHVFWISRCDTHDCALTVACNYCGRTPTLRLLTPKRQVMVCMEEAAEAVTTARDDDGALRLWTRVVTPWSELDERWVNAVALAASDHPRDAVRLLLEERSDSGLISP